MNAEQSVIDAIDLLVDEQLAGGPVDDYSVDRYDRCDLCGSSWHGLASYGCPGGAASDEERQQYLDGQQARRTRAGRIPSQYRFPRSRPTVRFWTTNADGLLEMTQGTVDVASIDNHDHITTIMGRLLSDEDGLTIRCHTWLPGDPAPDPQPVGEIESGLISCEVSFDGPDGFQPVGICDPDSVEISTDTEIIEAWGGRTVATRTQTSIEFSMVDVGPGLQRLLSR